MSATATIITVLLACKTPIIRGFQEPLTDLDRHYIKEAPYGCKARYPKSPCLKMIEKVGPVDYQMTCTKKVSK